MNPKIIKLIKMLKEKKDIDLFYIRSEYFDASISKCAELHSFESYVKGELKDEFETEDEKIAVDTLLRTICIEG